MNTPNLDPRLSDIRSELIGAVQEAIKDPNQRKKASLLNVALSLIKTAGGLDAPLSPQEKERVEAMRTALVDPRTGERLQLPFGPGVPGYREADPLTHDDDEDEGADESSTDF
jgi:hypothetical protein